jgi:hypothetical protein
MRRPPPAFLEQEVARLKQELEAARHAVLEVLPDELAQILGNYYACKNREEVWQWLDAAIDAVLERAERKSAREMGEFASASDRAFCPLCGRSADSVYGGKGFAYPEGLSRHLHGSFNARQCVVTKIVTDLAIDHATDRSPRLRPTR